MLLFFRENFCSTVLIQNQNLRRSIDSCTSECSSYYRLVPTIAPGLSVFLPKMLGSLRGSRSLTKPAIPTSRFGVMCQPATAASGFIKIYLRVRGFFSWMPTSTAANVCACQTPSFRSIFTFNYTRMYELVNERSSVVSYALHPVWLM